MDIQRPVNESETVWLTDICEATGLRAFDDELAAEMARAMEGKG